MWTAYSTGIICRPNGFLPVQNGTIVLLMASLQMSCEIGGIVPGNYSSAF